MNKLIVSVIIFLFFSMSHSATAQTFVSGASPFTYSPDKEIRAVWLATIGGIDWPRTYASTPATISRQKQELTDMLDKLKKININTILLQTRVRGTVIYPSMYEPWDGCMSGRPGVSPGYDPLRFAIEECHKRGMEIHAWVVTIPVGKWNNLGCRRLLQRYPKLITKIGDEGFMHPEQPQTAEYLSNICSEIIQNYNIDGIHLDYIRYPETWKNRINRVQGREYITRIVRKIHNNIKQKKPSVKISCSPLGKHDDLSRYSSKGWNARNTVCQDAQAWLRNGLMDQLYPMIYFKENNFYPFAIDWAEHCAAGQVAAGLGIYFLDPKEGNWRIDEVKRQLNVCRQLGLGQCFFRAKYLINNIQGLYDYLRIFNFQMPNKEGHVEQNGGVSALVSQKPTGPIPYLTTNQGHLTMPERHDGQDADMLLITSLAGNGITTKKWSGKTLDVSNLKPGTYIIYSLNRRGSTHRMAYLRVEEDIK